MYRIIGADGREYGPVPADQLRRWVAEGRANAATQALAEGATEWKPLGSLSEFYFLFTRAALPPVSMAATPLRTTNPFATASLVLGIISVTFGLCCYGVPFNIAGLVFSIIGLAQIAHHPQRYDGKGIAIAGLVLSILSLFLAVILALLLGANMNWREMEYPVHRL